MHPCSTFPFFMIIQEFSFYLKCGSTSPSWPDSSTGRVLHQHHRGQGSSPFSGLKFSGLSSCCSSTAKIWWSNSFILSLFLARVNKTMQCEVRPLYMFNMSTWDSLILQFTCSCGCMYKVNKVQPVYRRSKLCMVFWQGNMRISKRGPSLSALSSLYYNYYY